LVSGSATLGRPIARMTSVMVQRCGGAYDGSTMTSMLRRCLFLVLPCGFMLAAACKSPPKEQTPPPPAAPQPAPAPVVENPATTAKNIFHDRCAVCHGQQGLGDGPGSAALTPKPRNFTDAAWQASVQDDNLRAIIVKGGPAVGKSPGMAANPDLESKPDVVSELVKIVRAFKK
jgi:mono/diheme cytochrome c family protein